MAYIWLNSDRVSNPYRYGQRLVSLAGWKGPRSLAFQTLIGTVKGDGNPVQAGRAEEGFKPL